MGKTQVKIAVPDGLRSFLQDVLEGIEFGADETLIESDDLIQDKRTYGGLVDAAAGLFCFRYFAGEDTTPTWDFCVTRESLKRLLSEDIAYLDLWKCSDPECECLYESEDAYCSACTLKERKST
jgi:hypothetical protein